MTVLLSTISLMTKWRKIILEIVVLYINTESYGLTKLGKTGTFGKDKDGGIDSQSLSGSEESDCSLTDIPDKVQRIFIIIITILLCSLYTTIIIILAIKIIRDINMNNIESCTNTQSSYQVRLVGDRVLTVNFRPLLL